MSAAFAGALPNRRDLTQTEAQKLIPCFTREPTVMEALKDIAFPSFHLLWDYIVAEGRGSLLIYPQTLLVGLNAAAKWLANLSKVYSIRQ